MSSNPFLIHASLQSLGIDDQVSPLVTQAINDGIQTTLALIRDKWQTEAQNKLMSTRADYLLGLDFNSIRIPYDTSAPFNGAVVLQGTLPNMIEAGYPAFDEKIGFSKSPKIVQTKSGGWKLVIPFRHMTPGAYMYGNSMPKDIYKQAKKLQGKSALKIPGAGATSWTGYQHRGGSIYNGMQRIVKSYQKATQAFYMTFRTVSNNSDPMSWWHPGYKGAHIAESIMPYAKSTFMQVLSNNLNGITL